ncbi:MAG: hypothetical protein ACXVAY_15900 [Mucilaginibacter sp.]
MGLVFCTHTGWAQSRHVRMSRELKLFNKELADADLNFTLPPGFTEIKPVNTEDVNVDYAIQLPEADFEIWFQVISLKENKHGSKNIEKDKVANPDSLYLDMGRAQATTFMGDKDYLTRSIPPHALARYNADAGKTFLLNLPDSPVTKHYKYAMVVVLQKNHSGTLLATCLANELGPGFFRNLNMANSCIKFNQ